jgi:hypothetical protein
MFNPRKRLMVVVAFALVLSIMVTGYAFAAANTVDATNVGEGTGVISGYAITNVHYVLNTTTPSNVDSVSFTINPGITGSGKVYVRLASSGTFSAPCDTSGGTTVTCTLTGVTATSASNLTVVSGQ